MPADYKAAFDGAAASAVSPVAFIAQMAEMKMPLARGRNASAMAMPSRTKTVMLIQSGIDQLDSDISASAMTTWPITSVVSQAGPSSARISAKDSLHDAQ